MDSAGGCTHGRGAEKPAPQWTGTPVTSLPAGTARGPWVEVEQGPFVTG